MAPADRPPNRRVLPMPATDSKTSRDEIEPTRVDRTYLAAQEPEVTRPDGQVLPRAMKSEELTRRLDVSENPRFAPESAARRPDPRRTDIFVETPDVLGAPERTVVAPLPPRHVEVEPIPDAASTNGARVAAEAEERRAKRAREDAMREEALRREDARRRDEQRREQRREESRREKAEARATDKEVVLDGELRSPAKEKTQPAIAVRDAERQRTQRRREPTAALDEAIVTDADVLHSATRIERINRDSPWARLGTALTDVSNALVVSAKEGWYTLRHEGVRTFLEKTKPRVAQSWRSVRDFAQRLRRAAVAKAAEIGLVKPKRLNEFEQQDDDQLDHSRVEAWRRFNKGKTSSSYLQDDE